MPDARAPRGRAAAPPPRAGPPVAPLLALLLAAALSPPAPVLAAPAVVCDVAFTELSFSFANTDTALAPGMGKRLGDRVLYRNVTARPCNGTLTSLDAVVTTKSMTDAFIRRYEVGAKAGGTDDYFQVDLNITADGGFAEFDFAFFVGGTFGRADETRATLRNVKVTGIDIDAAQYNDFTGVLGYTWTKDTNLTLADGTRNPPPSFPFDPRFLGEWDVAQNIPQDQVTVSYGEIVNFMVRLGAAYADPSNYFGVAFKELSWGGVPTESFGSPQFTITYNGNGAASGAAPAPFTGPEGAPVAAAANPFSRPGYDFTGWNTKADGSGAALAAGGATFVPYLGETLFAQWAPSPLAAANDAYIGRYNAPLVVALPGSVLANDGPSSHPLSVAQIVAGVPAAKGTLVVNMTTGEFVFTPARGFRGNTTFTYKVSNNVSATQPTAVVNIFVPSPLAVTAGDDAYLATYGQPFSPPAGRLLLDNDSSPNAAPQLAVVGYTALSNASAGALSGGPDGNFTFTPAAGWSGSVTFGYNMTDVGTSLFDAALVTLTVAPPPPAARDDAYTCAPGGACSVAAALGLLANDASAANLTFAVVGAPTPSAGTLVVNPDGSFVWTPPNSTFTGVVTFTYTIQDSAGNQDTAVATLVVPPIARDDAYTCAVGQACSVGAAQGLFANDTASAPTMVGAPTPSDGTLAVHPDGSFDWTPPNSTFSGAVTFSYTIRDGAGNQATANVTLVVLQPAGPVAGGDSYTCPFGGVCSVDAIQGLLANDTSPAGLPLTVVGAPTPSAGTVAVYPNGSFEWTPPSPTFSGTATFKYTVQDSAGNQATADVTLVVPAPAGPAAQDDLYTCKPGHTCSVSAAQGLLANDTGLQLTLIGVDPPIASEGTVAVNPDGSFDWTPPSGALSGTVTFKYTVEDINGKQATATVTLVVPPAPDVLSPVAFNYTAAFNQDFRGPASVLDGISGVGPLAVVNFTLKPDPKTVGDVIMAPNGTFVFKPVHGWYGGTQFCVNVTDGVASTTACVSIRVDPPLPAANDDGYACPYGVVCRVPATHGLLANDSSPLNGTLAVVGAPKPSAGNLTVWPDGSFDWTPPGPGFHGRVNFTYDVKDAAGHTASAAVTIVVADPPPISAADDYYTAGGYNTPFALTLPGSILANDGPANAGGSLRFVQVLSGIPPADGALDWINPNGTFHFTPARGFRGNATFTYSVTDGIAAGDAVAAVTISVPQPMPLQARDDWYTAVYGQPFSPGAGDLLLANDFSPNAHPRLAVTGQGPLNDTSAGTLGAVSANGSFVFTPAAGWTGAVEFPYTITDQDTGLSAAAVAHVVIQAQPPPAAADDTYACGAGKRCAVLDPSKGLLSNDVSPSNTSLSVISVGTLPEGSFNWNPDGTFEFFPSSTHYWGVITVPYTIRDAFGTAAATLTIVIPDRGLPAPAYNYTVFNNETFKGPKPILDDFGPPCATGSWAVAGLLSQPPPAAGAVDVRPDGSFTFAPAPAWTGETQFCANATDGCAAGSVCVKLTVLAPPSAGLAAGDDWYTCDYNSPLVVALPHSILANDGPGNARGALAFAGVTVGVPAADGKLDWIKPDGTFQFTPARGFRGNATFTYAVTDGVAAAPAAATVNIFVQPPKALVANDDAYAATFNASFSPSAGASLLANDSSPNAAPQLEVVGSGPLSDPSAGALSEVNADGTFTFTPAAGWTGAVTFSYTITDKDTGLQATAVARITVPAPLPPAAAPDTYACPYDAVCAVAAGAGVLVNDRSPSGGALRIVGAPTPSVGTLAMQPDGSFVYTPPKGFSGPVTFTYAVTDGVSPATATALATLVVAPASVMIMPVNYTFETPYETPIDSSQSTNLLANIRSSDPTKNVSLAVQGVTEAPPAVEGNLTVKPDGSYTFAPAKGFSGVSEFCVAVADTSGGAATAHVCVKITVNYEQDVRFFIPLEPSAPGDKAECPDNATAAQIAADYRGAVKAEAGVLDVRVVNTTCTWISPTKVLLKIETKFITKDVPSRTAALTDINSPTSMDQPQPAPGLCAAPLTAALCGKAFGSVKVFGGCATIKAKAQCMPPELAAAKCVQPASVGAYVTAHAPAAPAAPAGGASTATIPRPTKPKQAQFEGCCVPPGQRASGSTCKHVRVGKKYQSASKTLPQNPLKQIGNCECFNIREYVQWDMFTRPNRKHPQHLLAPYPFSTGVATKVCTQKAGNSTKGCAGEWQQVGAVNVACSGGKLVLTTQSEKGFVMGDRIDVVATCGNSAFTAQSSCGVANAAGTSVAQGSGGTEVSSSEWDDNCVCKDTGRRPVLKIGVSDVISGAACQN